MKNATATHSLHQEYFVLQIDGRTKSGHRRFIDALRAGLRHQKISSCFSIKVRAMQIEDAGQTVLH